MLSSVYLTNNYLSLITVLITLIINFLFFFTSSCLTFKSNLQISIANMCLAVFNFVNLTVIYIQQLTRNGIHQFSHHHKSKIIVINRDLRLRSLTNLKLQMPANIRKFKFHLVGRLLRASPDAEV